MPRDLFIREKFTKERTAARKHAREYFQGFPKERDQTEVEGWRDLQSSNIEFTMKRLRERAPASMRRGFVLFGDDFAYVGIFAPIASARHSRPAPAAKLCNQTPIGTLCQHP